MEWQKISRDNTVAGIYNFAPKFLCEAAPVFKGRWVAFNSFEVYLFKLVVVVDTVAKDWCPWTDSVCIYYVRFQHSTLLWNFVLEGSHNVVFRQSSQDGQSASTKVPRPYPYPTFHSQLDSGKGAAGTPEASQTIAVLGGVLLRKRNGFRYRFHCPNVRTAT